MTKIYTLLALALVVGVSSCSSSRNAQNTDDLYYSNGNKKAAAANQGDYYSTAPSDNYVRMKATDPDRWSYFDDYNAYDSYYYSPVAASYGFGYPAYGFGYGMGYGMGFGYGLGFGMGYGLGFYDPYFAWNCGYNPYFYNPFYGGAVFVSHSLGGPVYSNLRPFNSLAYRNGVAAKSGTSAGRFYRQGMSGTSAYNSSLNGSGRTTNTYYRNNNNNYGNSYRPASSIGNGGGFRPSGGGGGFRPSGGGGFGGRH